MTRIVKINSFGGTTLDSANYKQQRVYDGGGEARDTYYVDVAGSIFDAAASGANTIVPGMVELRLIVKDSSSAANFVTKTNAIIALGGTSATLTGQDANGGTITCTARCLPVERPLELSTFYSRTAYFTLRFRKKTEWA